jgi:hypothetical protein
METGMSTSHPYRSGAIAFARALLFCTSLTIVSLAVPLPAQADQAEDDARYFFERGYTYCDAKLIAAYWGMSDVYDAKSGGGAKLRLDGGEEGLIGALQEGRRMSSCTFDDTGWSYDDAEALGKFWGVEVGDTKDKIASYYTTGQSKEVLKALEDARNG